MSNSSFRDHVKDDDHKNSGDQNSDQQQQQVESCKEDEESIDNIDGFDGGDKEDEEEVINVAVTSDDDKEQQQLVDGLSSTEDDENDGFRTPTSIEHRIPVPKDCPPAPKKSFKRKIEETSITEIIRSATKAIHDHIMSFKKARQDDDALS